MSRRNPMRFSHGTYYTLGYVLGDPIGIKPLDCPIKHLMRNPMVPATSHAIPWYVSGNVPWHYPSQMTSEEMAAWYKHINDTPSGIQWVIVWHIPWDVWDPMNNPLICMCYLVGWNTSRRQGMFCPMGYPIIWTTSHGIPWCVLRGVPPDFGHPNGRHELE